MARAVEREQHLVELRMPRALRYLYRGASVGSTVREPGEEPIAFLERAASSLRQRKAVRRAEQG